MLARSNITATDLGHCLGNTTPKTTLLVIELVMFSKVVMFSFRY